MGRLRPSESSLATNGYIAKKLDPREVVTRQELEISHMWGSRPLLNIILLALFALRGLFPETRQRVPTKILLEQIPIDGLSRDRSLTRCDNHLAVARCHTARGIETAHVGSQSFVHDDLSLRIHRGAYFSGQAAVGDVAACRKDGVHLRRLTVGERHSAKFPLLMVKGKNLIQAHGNTIFFQPSFVVVIPQGFSAVGS